MYLPARQQVQKKEPAVLDDRPAQSNAHLLTRCCGNNYTIQKYGKSITTVFLWPLFCKNTEPWQQGPFSNAWFH
jgi:hypothetical protein